MGTCLKSRKDEAEKERDGLCFSCAVHKIQWLLTPTAPTAIQAGMIISQFVLKFLHMKF